MANTTRCPCCRQLVGLPGKREATVRVRCPLCSAVFPLSEACPSDEEPAELLLELTPVADDGQPLGQHEVPTESDTDEYALASPSIVSSNPVDGSAESPASKPEANAASPVEMALVVRCPHCLAESRLGELVFAATEQPLTAASLAEALEVASGDEESEYALATEAWGSSLSPSSPESAGAGPPAATWAQRQPLEKGGLGQLVSVVLGGLLSLPIAYFVLNLIGGEQFDWFSVPLPLVSHTYQHLPAWWPAWARPNSPDDSKQESLPRRPRRESRATSDQSNARRWNDPPARQARDGPPERSA